MIQYQFDTHRRFWFDPSILEISNYFKFKQSYAQYIFPFDSDGQVYVVQQFDCARYFKNKNKIEVSNFNETYFISFRLDDLFNRVEKNIFYFEKYFWC